FIATPHRGSFRATGFVIDLVRRVVTLPVTLVKGFGDVLKQNPDALPRGALARLPTAVDNMSPNNQFIRTLEASPMAPDVTINSLGAVLGKGPLASQTAGVWKYDSAHLEVGSEKVVRSSHSTQAEPETIEEVRRLLRGQVFESEMRPRSEQPTK